MKNIAIICSSLNTGGAERIAGLLSKELANCYKVYLFLLSTDNIVYDYGGEIVDVGIDFPFYEERIKACKKLYHIDVSISFMEPLNFANIRTRLNEKVIISERCVQSLIEPPLTSQAIQIRRYYNYADEIVAISEGVKYDLIKTYGINPQITTIYNLIDKEKIINKSKENLPGDVLKFLDGKDYFLNVGRLEPQKNQKELLLQYVYYKQNAEDVKKLIILGTGTLKDELEDYICEYNLEKDVKIFPYTVNPFVFIKNAYAFIFSSKYEGLGNVILESMLLECPVISTDCLAGPRELLIPDFDYSRKFNEIKVGENGILVCNDESTDQEKSMYLSKAMFYLERDKKLYLNLQKNATNFMKNYTNQKIIGQWIEVIERQEADIKENGLNIDTELLKSAKHIFIYGAGVVGKQCFDTLKGKYSIEGFLISDRNSITEYMGLPVLEVPELEYEKDDVTIIIGVSDAYKDEVVKWLSENNYNKFVYPFL